MACIHHHSIIQTGFTALKNPPCSTYSSLPLRSSLATTDPFIISIVQPFPKCNIVAIIQDIVTSDGVLSLSDMRLRFFHIFSWLIALFFFFFSAEEYSIVQMCHSVFTHLPNEGHLSCVQVLAIMNKAAMNTCEQVLRGRKFQLIWVNTKEHNCCIIW